MNGAGELHTRGAAFLELDFQRGAIFRKRR